MRVLLTGANGFIGSAITALLLEHGHAVVAAVRHPDKFTRRFPRAAAFAADMNHMTAAADWQPHVAGVDAVINCAGALHDRHGQSLQAIHTDAPIALFNAAAAAGLRKIIQISAFSVGAPTAYAASKRAADEALMALNCDWVVLRPSIVYGAGAYGGTAMLRALAAAPLAIPVIGKGDQTATPIHVDDLAATVANCLETPSCDRQVIAPGGPQTLTLGEMCRIYRQWLGLAPAPFLHVPHALVRLAANLGDRIGNGPITTTSLAQLDHGNAVDSAAFTAATGVVPRAMVEALTATPAQTGDLWQARLYLLRPAIRTALVLLWLVSGLSGLVASTADIAAALPLHGVGADTVVALGRAASVIDLVIAALLIWNRAPRFTFAAQLLMVGGYTFILTLLSPGLWLALFGPLLKNLPILALVTVDRILGEER
jgi:uncharacterized protein YbjT (DUF2867 family)